MRTTATSFILLMSLPVPAPAAQDLCPAPTGTRIAASDGVRLHVMDWGGTGDPILFLSGLGTSAHIFDEFAPLFTNTHRVIGITRRGLPPSDTASADYSAAILTGDVLTVMDSLRVPAAHLIGWSFGGNEATLLAATSPQRVLSLTLLESYDRTARLRTGDSLKPPAPPPFLPSDSLSPLALQWRDQRLGNRPLPLSFICTSNRFAVGGRYLGPIVRRALRDSIADAMRKGMPRLPYTNVRQPVLALFAVVQGVEDRFPTYAGMTAHDQALADTLFRIAIVDMAAARARLRREIPQAQVIEIASAAHAIFRSHPEIVFERMREFLSRLQRKDP